MKKNQPTRKSFGIIYAATGERYIREAEASAASVRRKIPNADIILWTDDPKLPKAPLFNRIEPIKSPAFSFIDKITPLLETPFEKTLFLDTDTLVLENIEKDLDLLLDPFEFAYAHDVWRVPPAYKQPEIPISFPQPNSGVLAFRRTQAVQDLLQTWLDLYRQQMEGPEQPPHDQPALRAALYQSNVRFTILPSEYNIRTDKPLFIGGRSSPKIFHGRGITLKRALDTVLRNDHMAIADFSCKPTLYRSHYRGKTTPYRALIRKTRKTLRPVVHRLRGKTVKQKKGKHSSR